MSNLIPTTWRNSVEHWRENAADALDGLSRRHWWPPMRRRDRELAGAFWPNTLFFQGGPDVDVTEDAEAVHVHAELPGLDEKDFSVEILNDLLVLRGEKKVSHSEKKRDYHLSECSYGSFTRTVPLPCEIDAGKTSAHYAKGVLTVTLPKTPQSRARRIEVNIA